MKRTVVALSPCDSYEEKEVYLAVKAGITWLGGLDAFVKPDERVLLKPNLLGKAPPQKAVTTHPAVFGAVARLLREAGYEHVTYGDSPGFPSSPPLKVARACGIAQEAEKWRVPLADFERATQTRCPNGRACHSFALCDGVLEADAVINLPKMKTHALERVTGAMKNLYGCVCAGNKAAGHVRYPSADAFAEMVADLHRLVDARLHIMDGVAAMEGNGPNSGTPVAMNLLLLSADPVALDSVFAALVRLNPEDVPTCVSGSRAGLGTMDAGEIAVRTPEGELSVGEAARRYGRPEFDVFRGRMKKSLVAKFVPLLPFLQERPRVDLSRCIGCGICQQACPVPEKAVTSGRGQKAKYDYRKCIRCFCCQEMCPERAIEVSRNPLARILGQPNAR